MPTNANAYNSRVTDESLEKRFRDTFRSQGGAELVDDLYAQGVIVPVVDFTAAATGETLPSYLQTAWDFTTTANQISNATTTVVSNAGFYKVDVTWAYEPSAGSTQVKVKVQITDGVTTKVVWAASNIVLAGTSETVAGGNDTFYVFLRSGDSLQGFSAGSEATLDIFTRQVATVSGDLVDPSGFTSS
jgi:hypothetical protein